MNRLQLERLHFTTTCAVALAAFGLGAAVMYLFDPASGARRRAIARDKTLSAADDAADMIGGTARDLHNRARSTVAEAKGTLA